MKHLTLLLAVCILGCVEPLSVDAQRVNTLSRMMSQPVAVVQETQPEQVVDKSDALEQIKKTLPTAVEAKQDLTPPASPPVVVLADEFADWYVVEWTQPNCPPCRKWEVVEKPVLQRSMSVRVIDIQKEPTLARKHGIRSTPTIQLCRRSTKKVRVRFVGYTPAAAIKTKARELNNTNLGVSNTQPASYKWPVVQPVRYGLHWSVGTAANPRHATRKEIISHLQGSHRVDHRRLARLSMDQLLFLHDSLHTGQRI